MSDFMALSAANNRYLIMERKLVQSIHNLIAEKKWATTIMND